MRLHAGIRRIGTVVCAGVLVLATGIGVVGAMEPEPDGPAARGDDDEGEEEAGDGDPITSETFGTTVVEVLELERTSDTTVTLRFRLVNEGTEELELWDNFGEDTSDYTMGGVYLVDELNGKKYLSLRDTNGACLCTELESSSESIDAGDEREFFVKFPAPPDDVDEISVGIPPVGSLDNVEIGG